MRNLYKLSEFKEINSIVEESIATRKDENGNEEYGLCLKNAEGKEYFVLYGGTRERLSNIFLERKTDIMVLKREDNWVITLRAHFTTTTPKNNSPQKGIGIINWYASEPGKGYGVITCLHEKASDDFDVFLHHTAWTDTIPVSKESNFLVFDYIQDKNRKRATSCRFLTMDDDWSELAKILIRNHIDNPDGRWGKKRVFLLNTLLQTLKLHITPLERGLFVNKIEEYGIDLTDDQRKVCLINGLLPLSSCRDLVNLLSTEELINAIKNSGDEDGFVEIVDEEITDIINVWEVYNSRVTGFSYSGNISASEIHRIIMSFNSLEIQKYLCDALLAKFPTDLHPETIEKVASAAKDLWEKRNKKLPMSIMKRYPVVQTAIWFSGEKIPLDRDFLCHFIETNPWFFGYLIKRGWINLNPLFSLAKKRLSQLSSFANDDDFQKIALWYKYLKAWNKTRIIKDSSNPVANIFLWIDGEEDNLNLEFAAKTFIYLKSSEQVQFIKRLVQKRAQGDTSITLETIYRLIYADLELHRDNEAINQDRSLDISTHVLVQLIKRFSETGAFMLESELFLTVFNGITTGIKSFKLDHYFDKCPGRCQAAGAPRESANKTYYWFPREFCDAQKANKKDENGNNFYWCGNARCYKQSIELHTTEQWSNYSLWDIIHIFKINTYHTEESLYNSYITFIAQVNKYNQIAEKLKCRECGEVLYPQLPEGLSNYHYYSVTQFYCLNGDCSQYNKGIYLNHCFHPGCVDIIDSRDSKQCENGRYICPSCASCCTDHEFDKAVRYKQINGGYLSSALIDCHRNHKGHNDKGVFFCHKCGSQLKVENHDGESLKAYMQRCGYTKIQYAKYPCKTGYQMPVMLFDGRDFIALGKDIKDKSLEEIKPILKELRVVEGQSYKSIVHFSSLSSEAIYYCENCKDVKYKAKPYEYNTKYINPEYRHVGYILERIS